MCLCGIRAVRNEKPRVCADVDDEVFEIVDAELVCSLYLARLVWSHVQAELLHHIHFPNIQKLLSNDYLICFSKHNSNHWAIKNSRRFNDHFLVQDNKLELKS